MMTTWQEANGDETYALDWPLDENSRVWEIGGFEGRWAQQIWDKFHCNITIFEPQLWAVERMKKRFEGIFEIDILPYGLWVEDCVMAVGDFHTDGASVFKNNRDVETGEFRNIVNEVYLFDEEIDVCLMNVEGAEYVLIPELVSSGIIGRFSNFWCQFHPGLIENADNQTKRIFNMMSETHDLLWDFFPTAIAWRRR